MTTEPKFIDQIIRLMKGVEPVMNEHRLELVLYHYNHRGPESKECWEACVFSRDDDKLSEKGVLIKPSADGSHVVALYHDPISKISPSVIPVAAGADDRTQLRIACAAIAHLLLAVG